ncbi:hypothetical protein ACTXT7_002536 [Hymenolepis weldensis]
MVETFKVLIIYVAIQAVLPLEGQLVQLYGGDGISQTVPDLADLDFTEYLGYNFGNAQREISPEVKEKLCSVTLQFEDQMAKAVSRNSLAGKILYTLFHLWWNCLIAFYEAANSSDAKKKKEERRLSVQATVFLLNK